MWREESGILEMLITYIGGYQKFCGWSNWRNIVIDILSCHEYVRKQRIASACSYIDRDLENEQFDLFGMPTGSFDSQSQNLRDLGSRAHPIGWPSEGEHQQQTRESRLLGFRDEQTKAEECATFQMKAEEDVCEIIPAPSECPRDPKGSREIIRDKSTFPKNDCVQTSEIDFSKWSSVSSATSRVEMNPPVFSNAVPDEAVPREPPQTRRGRPSQYKSSLPESERTMMYSSKHLSCSYCSKTFLRPSEVVVHERTHTGIKPYTCNVCSRKFSHSSNLRVHERTHSGHRPFPCSFCGQRFLQKIHKIKHEKRHLRRVDSVIDSST